MIIRLERKSPPKNYTCVEVSAIMKSSKNKIYLQKRITNIGTS